MTGDAPSHPLMAHQGVVHFDIFFALVSLASCQLTSEWSELALPRGAKYMKGSGLYLVKRGSNGVTSCCFLISMGLSNHLVSNFIIVIF